MEPVRKQRLYHQRDLASWCTGRKFGVNIESCRIDPLWPTFELILAQAVRTSNKVLQGGIAHLQSAACRAVTSVGIGWIAGLDGHHFEFRSRGRLCLSMRRDRQDQRNCRPHHSPGIHYRGSCGPVNCRARKNARKQAVVVDERR
jgi:hypothetical protein